MRKNVLELSSYRARKFFLDPEMYLNLELPPYYKFDPVLSALSKKMGWKTLEEKELYSAKSFDDVNHIVLGNKDGNYAWRKYELINPLLYLSLVNTICNKKSWEIITDRFKELNTGSSIECISIPVLKDTLKKQKASQISEWLNLIEKESIKLALDYEYLYETDIVGCYSSIYTHSISWALHNKPTAKNKRGFSSLLGNEIDHHIQAMCYGQTNGIPEGSALMDFIAEIVLAYTDMLLLKKIKRLNKDEYHILRYRDDYKIFVRNQKDGDFILKELSSVLADLGMSLNTTKTKKNDKIILGSIKEAKLIMLKSPLSKKLDTSTLRNELLTIYELGSNYPNSGAVTSRLAKINKRVENKWLQKNPDEFVSILINIAFENPKAFPIVAALISKTINKLSQTDKDVIFEKLLRKIRLLPNSGLIEIWLQRITIKNQSNPFYQELLCRKTYGEDIKLFNSDWIKSIEIKQIIDDAMIIDQKTIKNLDAIIDIKEIALWEYQS